MPTLCFAVPQQVQPPLRLPFKMAVWPAVLAMIRIGTLRHGNGPGMSRLMRSKWDTVSEVYETNKIVRNLQHPDGNVEFQSVMRLGA